MKKIISCKIYEQSIKKIINEIDYDMEFLEIGMHNEPSKLKARLQSMINDCQHYDEIFLLYGICGNSIEGLYSEKSRLYVLRVHDCFATMLGSNKRYFDLVRDNGNYSWRCESNMNTNYLSDKYNEFCDLYGEENAEYLISIYGKKTDLVYYVDFKSENDEKNISSLAEESRVLILEGSLSMLEKFFCKDKSVSLQINKNEKIECLYDETEIIKTVPKE
ncbi:DUF1638 domain-containing protein [Anaerorhabdus sp.]|jgi:hypothetical protein|uniref:DUF1638 domain-containing protein n=1 Tax=Anaerorhabdus sp. TaxID=1872524 RepID=UPI002FC9B299